MTKSGFNGELPEIRLVDIPYLHPKVDVNDLQKNGKLLSDIDIATLKDNLYNQPDKRYTKKELKKLAEQKPLENINSVYPIRKNGNDLFAIYKGEEQKKHLGKGAYGKVKLAQNLETGQWYAIKLINKTYETLTAGETEKTNLYITGKLKDSYSRKKDYQDQFEIIMELAAGSPVDVLIKEGRLYPIDLLDLGLGQAESIRNLHQTYRLLHKDIKPENFIHDLAQRKTTPIDLGHSSHTENLNIQDANRGTPFYEAPENKPEKKEIFAFSNFTEKTDVYALGLTFAKMFNPTLNKPPASIQDIKFSNRIGDIGTEHNLAELILDMLKEEPNERITMEQVCMRWKAIRDEYSNNHLNIRSMIQTICYLDVNDYLQANEEVQKEILLALRSADAVHLISSKKTNPLDLMKVKHELVSKGLTVFDKSLRYSANVNHHIIKTMLDTRTNQLEHEHNINYLAYYLRLPKDMEKKFKDSYIPTRVLEFAVDKEARERIPKDYKYYNLLMEKNAERLDISLHHKERILELLHNKKEYYELHPDKRMTIISTVIDKFERNEKFTYKKLLNELNDLEEKLIENRPSKFLRYFEKNFGIFRSNPSAAVHKEIRKIEKELGMPKKNK